MEFDLNEPCNGWIGSGSLVYFRKFIASLPSIHNRANQTFNLFSFQSKHQTDAFVMIIMLIIALTAFGYVFFACEMGERFSNQFESINDQMDQFKWYSFPLEVQRMLPAIILIAQQPVGIECFGSVLCLRESFKKVSAGCHHWFHWFHGETLNSYRFLLIYF